VPPQRIALGLLATLLMPFANAQFVERDDSDLFGVDDFEITPNGRYAIGRENTFTSTMLVFDLLNGSPVTRRSGTTLSVPGGVAQDAIAVTNDRAVMLGSTLLILDLTVPGSPILAEVEVGQYARDLAITPDERLVIVRGGEPISGSNPGGQFVIDLATGNVLATAPGMPGGYTFQVDSVVASDTHAVVASSLAPLSPNPMTRVTIWDLGPTIPVIAYETDVTTDLAGSPNDLAIAPGGGFVALRSELEVAMVDLTGPVSSLAWRSGPLNMPGPFGSSVVDSIEATDTHIATLSRWSNGGIGAQVDVFDTSGAQYAQTIFGDPHDLTFTPAGDRLICRTSSQVVMYDMASLPAMGSALSLQDYSVLPTTHTSFGAGEDSIVATDTHVVALARDEEEAQVAVYDITGNTLEPVLEFVMPDRPIDVDLSADGETAWVSGFTYVLAIDLVLGEVVFEHDPIVGGGYPWCDGLAVGDDKVVAFGYAADPISQAIFADAGWVSIIDTFRDPVSFCAPNANSTGASSALRVTGSARVGSNDLTLWAANTPANAWGVFLVGDTTQNAISGDGIVCIAGDVGRFPAVMSNASGVARTDVNLVNMPSGGGVPMTGTTWNFQFVYRDSMAFGTGWNLSDAVAVDFVD
jgi:hypothetical protein